MPTHEDAIDAAARALRRRDRSRRDVDERLARAGIDDAERERTLDTLERIGYLDDTRFAVSRAETLASRGYGDAAIAADLEQQGLAGEPLAAALAALEPEPQRARRLVSRLGPGPRTAGHLIRKGFDADAVADLLGEDGLRGTSGGADDPTAV